jgi:protein-tyrosine phosphatase
MHGSANPQLSQTLVDRLASIHEGRDHADDLTPGVQDRIGDRAHQADGTAPVHQTDAASGKDLARDLGRVAIRRIASVPRPAVDRDAPELSHGANPSACLRGWSSGPTPTRASLPVMSAPALTPAPVDPVRVTCGCLGNICRSPMAAAILRERAATAGTPMTVSSAGTDTWQTGNPAHPATVAELAARGITIAHAARTFRAADLGELDLVLAMDHANAAHLEALAPTPDARARIHLIRDFDPAGPLGREVPDPYYGEPADHRTVFDMLDAACRGLVDRLATEGPPPWARAAEIRP